MSTATEAELEAQGREMLHAAWAATDGVLEIAQQLGWAQNAALDCDWRAFDRFLAAAACRSRALRRLETQGVRA